jgi:hypothetical protein
MSNRKLFFDQFGSQTRFVHVDTDDPEKFTIETLTDCSADVERARLMSDMGPSKEFRFEAAIPMDVLERSMREGWFNDTIAWKRWANNPDNRAFRADYGHGVKTL